MYLLTKNGWYHFGFNKKLMKFYHNTNNNYLELLNEFIENYIVPDTSLTDAVKNYIPEYYDGSNNLTLAQDILYCMLNKNEEDTNYWVFQGNLKIYDVVSALNDNALKSWSVKAHKDTNSLGKRE